MVGALIMPTYSVAQFIATVNDQIYGQFSVEGEVSRYNVSQGKWVFFYLKDDTAVMNCFIPLFRLKIPLVDGMRIKVVGTPKVREQTGGFSFTVDAVELVGEGALKRAYEMLKLKLDKEGLFAAERKRILPQYPDRVGVIASRDSAAWGDFKRIANNRWGGVKIDLYHVAVQGASAEAELVEAFNYFNAAAVLPDVLVVIRGGGSLEDLAAFNSESVARAVAGSRVPVVSGVGHERDETLCDLAADVRASTPSNAAEIVLPSRDAVAADLAMTGDYLTGRVENCLLIKQQKIAQAVYVLQASLSKPLEQARMLLNKFSGAGDLLANKAMAAGAFLESSLRLFNAHDPKKVLARGFSITRLKKTGKIIKRVSDVKKGESITTEFSGGQTESVAL